jgi:hypothetical protein
MNNNSTSLNNNCVFLAKLVDNIRNDNLEQIILFIEDLKALNNVLSNYIVFEACKFGDFATLRYILQRNKWKGAFKQIVIEDSWLALEWASLNNDGSHKLAIIYEVLIEHLMRRDRSIRMLDNCNLQWGVLQKYVRDHWSVHTYQDTLKQMFEFEEVD